MFLSFDMLYSLWLCVCMLVVCVVWWAVGVACFVIVWFVNVYCMLGCVCCVFGCLLCV